MKIELLLAATVLALGACASAEAMAQTHAPEAAASPKAVVTPLTRTGKTISGQPLRLPQGDAEVVAAAVEIPAGGSLPIHKHPWSRIVYVEQGVLTVANLDTGATLDFTSGQVLPEVIDQWHEARAGAGPVKLVVIDLVPPGVTNMVMKPQP
jgi:quercetin dioxygenase-like cupin family protein